MRLSVDKLQNYAAEAIDAIKAQFPGVMPFVCLHDGTQIRETLIKNVIAQFAGQKTERAAKYIAAKSKISSDSTYLGVTCAKQKVLFGLKEKSEFYPIILLNKNIMRTKIDVETAIFHALSKALDSIEHYEKNFKGNQSEFFPVLYDTKTLSRTHSNLKSDVFIAAIQAFTGRSDALEAMAKERGEQILAPKTRFMPEEYPYLMAMEALKFAYDTIEAKPPANLILQKARELSNDVMRTFEISHIYQWWNFAKPAQDMAWRGFSKEDIINMAVHTSDDPHVRSIGIILADILDIETKHDQTLMSQYNAFVNHEQNYRAHKKAIEAVFEQTVTEAAESEDGKPLYDAANKQNMGLTEGKVLGWCANALQAAGQAYDKAKQEGIEAVTTARSEFETTIEDGVWDTLKNYGERIVNQSRNQGLMSMDDAISLAEKDPTFMAIFKSLQATLKDPNYIAKLEAANDKAEPTPGFVSPSVQKPQPSAQPQMAMARPVSAPGLSMGSSPSVQKRTATNQKPSEDDQTAPDENNKSDEN